MNATASVTSQPVSMILYSFNEFIMIVLVSGSKKFTNIVIKMLKLIKPSNMKRQFFIFASIFLVEKNPKIKKRHGIITTGPMSIKYLMIL